MNSSSGTPSDRRTPLGSRRHRESSCVRVLRWRIDRARQTRPRVGASPSSESGGIARQGGPHPPRRLVGCVGRWWERRWTSVSDNCNSRKLSVTQVTRQVIPKPEDRHQRRSRVQTAVPKRLRTEHSPPPRTPSSAWLAPPSVLCLAGVFLASQPRPFADLLTGCGL